MIKLVLPAGFAAVVFGGLYLYMSSEEPVNYQLFTEQVTEVERTAT